MTKPFKYLWIVFAAMLLTLSGCKKDKPDSQAEPAVYTQTIYLVRHAEKQKGDNPGLTEAGKARAQVLSDLLADKNVTYIHSTDYKRTLETAAPLSDATGIEVTLYDPGNLWGLADRIKAAPGVHIVVGHSNTTPELAGQISGQIMDIMPETEYNRFIEIGLAPDGTARHLDVSQYGAQ